MPGFPRKKSKYRNVRTEFNGRLYDSKAEAERAAVLDMLQKSDLIRFWQPQVTFQLGPDHVYRCDFLVWLPDGSTYAEDIKGVETAQFRKHKKLWKKYAPCELRVIFKDRTETVIPESLIRRTTEGTNAC